jgi:hypothetical protein
LGIGTDAVWANAVWLNTTLISNKTAKMYERKTFLFAGNMGDSGRKMAD